MISLKIDASSAAPASEQVRSHVATSVKSGALAPGDRMPTVRALADELGIAANTVAKAYRQLEADGVIETRGRNGTFIATSGDPTERNAQRAAADFATRMRELDVDADVALDLARRALGQR